MSEFESTVKERKRLKKKKINSEVSGFVILVIV